MGSVGPIQPTVLTAIAWPKTTSSCFLTAGGARTCTLARRQLVRPTGALSVVFAGKRAFRCSKDIMGELQWTGERHCLQIPNQSLTCCQLQVWCCRQTPGAPPTVGHMRARDAPRFVRLTGGMSLVIPCVLSGRATFFWFIIGTDCRRIRTPLADPTSTPTFAVMCAQMRSRDGWSEGHIHWFRLPPHLYRLAHRWVDLCSTAARAVRSPSLENEATCSHVP